MIDGSVVEHCKDVENLNGGTLTEAWITAAIDGKVSGRFLKVSSAVWENIHMVNYVCW